MNPVYERENLILTEFDTEDVITTSGVAPVTPTIIKIDNDNSLLSFGSFDQTPGSWF